jgi:addiction module HigA family antidote
LLEDQSGRLWVGRRRGELCLIERMRKRSGSKTITRDPSELGVVVSPGEMLLEEFIRPLGLKQPALAAELGVSLNRLNEIVLGKRGITADTAIRLARRFKMSPQFWMRLQADWDLAQALARDANDAASRPPLPSPRCLDAPQARAAPERLAEAGRNPTPKGAVRTRERERKGRPHGRPEIRECRRYKSRARRSASAPTQSSSSEPGLPPRSRNRK